MNKNISYLLFNFFLALLLWKGIEGNKTAQYIYVGFNWLGVWIISFNVYALNSIKKIESVKMSRPSTSLWVSIPVTVGFFCTLIWFGWIWTAVAVVLEFYFVQEYAELYDKKKLEVS
jgi:hypothetical protein